MGSQELMAVRAAVSARRMFGGHGLYREGLMFAPIVDDGLFFRTDANNVTQFEQAGSRPFVYRGRNRVVQMSCWSAPTPGPGSLDEMTGCCHLAYGPALRAQAARAGKAVKGRRK